MADGIRTVGMTLRLDKAHHASPDNVVVIRAGEADATNLSISVKNAGTAETFTSSTKCYLCIPMPENESMELECTRSNNVVSVTLDPAVGAVAETKPNCYLKFVNENNQTVATTESFTIRVMAGAGELDYDLSEFEPYLSLRTALDSTSEAITSAYLGADAANNAAADARAAAALVTSPQLYVVGETGGTVTVGITGAE